MNLDVLKSDLRWLCFTQSIWQYKKDEYSNLILKVHCGSIVCDSVLGSSLNVIPELDFLCKTASFLQDNDFWRIDPYKIIDHEDDPAVNALFLKLQRRSILRLWRDSTPAHAVPNEFVTDGKTTFTTTESAVVSDSSSNSSSSASNHDNSSSSSSRTAVMDTLLSSLPEHRSPCILACEETHVDMCSPESDELLPLSSPTPKHSGYSSLYEHSERESVSREDNSEDTSGSLKSYAEAVRGCHSPFSAVITRASGLGFVTLTSSSSAPNLKNKLPYGE